MTVTYTATQVGNQLGAAFVSTAPNLIIGVGFDATGIQYTVPAPNELRYRTLSLNATWTAAASTGVLTIGLVNSTAAAAFSGTNLPAAQTLIPLYSATHTFGAGSYSFNLNLGVSTPPTGSFVGGSLEVAGQVLDHSSFGGNLALVLTYTGAGSTFGAPTLVGDEVPFLSGLPSSKTKLSRADWCPRCGRPMFREQLIEDGFTKSLVCSDCWDRAEQQYPPYKPPKEINP